MKSNPKLSWNDNSGEFCAKSMWNAEKATQIHLNCCYYNFAISLPSQPFLGYHGHSEKRWQPRNGCDGRLIAKFLITTIQVNLCCLHHISLGFGIKFTWTVVIKNFAISLPSQPFLGIHLGFHIFFHYGLLGPHTIFYSWAVLD